MKPDMYEYNAWANEIEAKRKVYYRAESVRRLKKEGKGTGTIRALAFLYRIAI